MTPLDTSHQSNRGTKRLLSIREGPPSLFCGVPRAPLRRLRSCDVAGRWVQLSPVGTRSPRCSWSAAWERVSSRRRPQATRCQIPRLPGQPQAGSSPQGEGGSGARWGQVPSSGCWGAATLSPPPQPSERPLRAGIWAQWGTGRSEPAVANPGPASLRGRGGHGFR